MQPSSVAVWTIAVKVLYNSSQPGERPVIYTQYLQRLGGGDSEVNFTLVDCLKWVENNLCWGI